MLNRIFSTENPKAVKALGLGWLNAIHYMAPFDLSGVNLCPHSTAACRALCLGWHSGQAAMVPAGSGKRVAGNSVRQSRLDKARRFMRSRQAYLRDVIRSIELAQIRATREGLRLAVRLNGATDIAWEGIRDESGYSMMQRFPALQFVDYTKSVRRALAFAAARTNSSGAFPANYHLCFSRSESNEADCIRVLQAGGNVAVVFSGTRPTTWNGFPVIDGDAHDLRFLDPAGCVVGLTPKGARAKRDRSGFVVRSNP